MIDLAPEILCDLDLLREAELRRDLVGEDDEASLLKRREPPRAGIEDAKRPEGQVVGAEKEGAGIEAQTGPPETERIVARAGIGERVRNDREARPKQRMRTDRPIDRCLVAAEPDLRLEPLARLVDEADERDRCVAQTGRKLDQRVEARLARRVQQTQPSKGREALTSSRMVVGLHGVVDPRYKRRVCDARQCRWASPRVAEYVHVGEARTDRHGSVCRAT